MRTLATDRSPAADGAASAARGARAPTARQRPEERLRYLQRTAGNRATAALVQRSCSCAGRHETCEECERGHAAARPLARRRADELDETLGALRAAVAARAPAAPVVSSRNPTQPGQREDEEEVTTRDCSVASGPTYTPTGTIPVTVSGGRKRAPFTFAATFNTASWYQFWSSTDAACCEVRQYIKWDQAFETWRGGPPHSGFPAGSAHGVWHEDRDTADKRYGHRSGTHSDPIAGGGDEYTTGGRRDQANGNQYNGRDTPGGPTSMTGQFQFKLGVVDTCNSNTTKATSPVITINW